MINDIYIYFFHAFVLTETKNCLTLKIWKNLNYYNSYFSISFILYIPLRDNSFFLFIILHNFIIEYSVAGLKWLLS